MIDWTKSMQQTYEFYIVDPASWKDVRQLRNVTSCTLNRDSEVETLGSASFDTTESIGECYVRVYLVSIQNGEKDKRPLGTYLVQTPSTSFDGKVKSITLDAYTPLLELKEKKPPVGYHLKVGDNILSSAYTLTQEHLRAPVSKVDPDDNLSSNFVAEEDDTWLSYISDLLANNEYKFDVDESGKILFAPVQELDKLQPIWTFDDGNSSILYPEITVNHDIYGIPNVVEVVYSSGTKTISKTAINDDPNSPTSTVNRGREITHRVTDPKLFGLVDENKVQVYADKLLKELSTVEYTVSYTHGFCPVRVGDCVRLNYTRAGITNVKAKIISQSINCIPGCPVTEKAVFITKLWR